MKTRLLKLSCLALTLFTFIGCNDCSECEKDCKDELKKIKTELENKEMMLQNLGLYVDKIFENQDTARNLEPEQKTMCDFGEDEAVIEKDSWYITKLGSVKGKAFLKIPIPKGHKITKASLTDNVVTYEVTGSVYTKDFEYSHQYLSGLSEVSMSPLKIHVYYNFESDECETTTTLTRKHKGSVLGGQPLLD